MEAGSEGCGHLPGAGLGSFPARPPPAPCAPRSPESVGVLPLPPSARGQTGPQPGDPRCGALAPRGGSPGGRPGAIYSARASRGAGWPVTGWRPGLLWLPHLPPKYNCRFPAPGKQRGGGGPGAEEAARRKGKCKGRGEGRWPPRGGAPAAGRTAFLLPERACAALEPPGLPTSLSEGGCGGAARAEGARDGHLGPGHGLDPDF